MQEYIEKLKALVESRRFQAALVGILAVVFQDVLGLSEEQALTVAGLIATWIGSDTFRPTVRKNGGEG